MATISWTHIYFANLLILSLPSGSHQGAHEKRLLNDIFKTREYNKLERPVLNESSSLEVRFGLTLQQIINVDEKNEIINTNLWLNMEWNDYNLAWNESEYGNITSIRIPPSKIWRPDILMYNSADVDIDSTYHTNVIVSSNGDCLWVPPGLFFSTCKINIRWFPFDDQHCDMKFGSWTYDGSAINLTLKGDSGDTSSFYRNGEWDLIGLPARRRVEKYACCPQRYIDITFTMHVRRRTLYFGFNLIIPCVLISSMALLSFTLPPDSGEKISLGVTILLSLTVFLLLVAETMPPTSDAVPLIGMYFACIMLMCSLSVVFTVLVLNYHHRTPDTHQMPPWVEKVVCEWLAWLLRMNRPGHVTARKRVISNSRLRGDTELSDRSSRSLLANVLDMEDNVMRSTLNGNAGCFGAPPRQCSTLVECRLDSPGGSSSSNSELRYIISELRVLTNKVRNDEEVAKKCNDWKFAALVIDRLCLWFFTIFTVTTTLVILFSAPHTLV